MVRKDLFNVRQSAIRSTIAVEAAAEALAKAAKAAREANKEAVEQAAHQTYLEALEVSDEGLADLELEVLDMFRPPAVKDHQVSVNDTADGVPLPADLAIYHAKRPGEDWLQTGNEDSHDNEGEDDSYGPELSPLLATSGAGTEGEPHAWSDYRYNLALALELQRAELKQGVPFTPAERERFENSITPELLMKKFEGKKQAKLNKFNGFPLRLADELKKYEKKAKKKTKAPAAPAASNANKRQKTSNGGASGATRKKRTSSNTITLNADRPMTRAHRKSLAETAAEALRAMAADQTVAATDAQEEAIE